MGEQIQIIRLNIHEPIGTELTPVYGVEFAPTFIFFDANGTEVWRQIGGLDAQHVRDSLE